jgi:hypothetical protein
MPITFAASKEKAEKINLSQENFESVIKYNKLYTSVSAGEILASSKPSTSVFNRDFLSTVIHAYSYHNNLIISPDNIWISILIQLSYYINGNSEQLRDKFVNFKDKQQLVVIEAGNLKTANYKTLAKRFCDEMDKYLVNPKIKDWIIPDFTTTTETDKIVGAICVMASFKSYFDFKFCLQCGIPNITLLGIEEDWKKLLELVQQLHLYDYGENKTCQKWQEMLEPICKQFIDCFNGKIDMDFWSKICHKQSYGSGSSKLSGWITSFMVFDEKGKWHGKSTLDMIDIPLSMLSVPVEIDDNGKTLKAMMFAGNFCSKNINEAFQSSSDWFISLVDDDAIKKRQTMW